MALQRGEVVEELRRLALLLLLELGDRARPAGNVRDDRGGLVLLDALAAKVAAAVETLPRGGEPRLDEPVWLGDEGTDLELPAGDERQGRGLNAAERHGAVERGAEPDRGRARRVHADEPVRLGAGAGGLLEQPHLLPVPEILERVANRRLRHRVQPQALDRLLDPRRLVEIGEDQLALAPSVAGVDDHLDVLVLHQLVDCAELLLGLVVVGDELELRGDDRQIGEPPLLQLVVVLIRLGEADQVADRPRDDVVAVDQVRLVLALLESARQRGREIAAHRGLFGDDEGLRHG